MSDKTSSTPSLLPDPLTPERFRARRRQIFMTVDNYRDNERWFDRAFKSGLERMAELQAEGDVEPFAQSGLFKDHFWRLHLRYTAGEPIAQISQDFDDMFAWLCKWHMDYPPYLLKVETAYPAYDELGPVALDATPLDFGSLEDYHEVVAVLGLAVLLGKADALRIAAELFTFRRGKDMLVEELLSPAARPVPCATLYHLKPYDPLVDAYYAAESPADASAHVKQYLEGWYKAMEGCHWHDDHRVQKVDQMTPYNGYWCFEAAAICLIHGIDDSSFRDHLVYPKDLADWARQNDALARLRAAGQADVTALRPRCEGGQPCPREGVWFSPARPDSRRHFRLGETLPALGGAWGLTIWQWEAGS